MTTRLRPVAVMLGVPMTVLSFVGCCRMPEACRDPGIHTAAAFSPAEEYLLRGLFSMTVTRRFDGTTSASLGPTFWGWAPARVEDEEEIYHRYRKRLFDAHYALVQEEQSYAERFKCLEDLVIARIGHRSSHRQGCECVYPAALRLGIYRDLLKRVGPLPFTDVPPSFAGYDPCGSDDEEPFASFYDEAVRDDTPAGARPFHYCSGTGGITISGGLTDPHVRAHFWLYRNDPSYEEAYDRVVAPFVERAAEVDPLDIEATAKITDDLRRALVESGIADRIQQRVDTEVSKEKGQAN